MTAPAKPDPLGVECPYCNAMPRFACRSIPRYRGPYDAWTDWTERTPHAARVKRAEEEGRKCE